MSRTSPQKVRQRASWGLRDIHDTDGARAARRIVIGVDGSKASEAALCWAAKTAVAQHGGLVVVRVCQPHILAPYAPSAARRSAEEERAIAAVELKTEVRDVIRNVPEVPVRELLATGLPARILLHLAEGADLLVLGGRTQANRLDPAIGPVALACLQHAPCPVVIVPPPPR